MGVWIETLSTQPFRPPPGVTPCMGVWIETHLTLSKCLRLQGHTLYGCVDWNRKILDHHRTIRCHTLYGCVDWNSAERVINAISQSHPVWVCGLKLPRKTERSAHRLSHPVWVCGLKLNSWQTSTEKRSHTLYGCVDWNECEMVYDLAHIKSHPVWVCGLKLLWWHRYRWWYRSHPVWVCGLKLLNVLGILYGILVTPCMGVWIETDKR